jgi:hypothetical protein
VPIIAIRDRRNHRHAILRQPAGIAGIDRPPGSTNVHSAVNPDLRNDASEATNTAARWRSPWLIARILMIVVLSGVPILAISADVFDLIPQHTTALLILLPLIAVLAVVAAFSPHRIDMVLGQGLIAGMVACLVYDAFRLFCVHALGMMGDFIPVMGRWVTGATADSAASAVVGYMWRYLGDGGGLGVAFFALALAVGFGRRSVRPLMVVIACIGYAVFVWSGLIATVALSAYGEQRMFHLTAATIWVTLIGHLIFGLVLGLLFVRARRAWYGPELEWPPILSVPTWLRARNVFAFSRSRENAVSTVEAETPQTP